MGTKKTKKTAARKPRKAEGFSHPQAGQVWSDPRDGKKFDVVECAGNCLSDPSVCHFADGAGTNCPRDDEGLMLCERHGVSFKPCAAAEPAPEAEPVDQGAPVVRTEADIPLAAISPAPWNKRGEIDPESVADLVASIRAVGLMQRVTVMGDEQNGDYVIIAGHRRFEACRIAGLDPVPCVVVECSNKRAHMMTAVENFHRLDLSVMQEVEVIEDLLDSGNTAEEIAAQTGWHVRKVYRRASIRDLSSVWRNLAHALDLSAAFLEEVARLPESTQRELNDRIVTQWNGKEIYEHGGNVTDIKKMIADLTKALKTAPWAKLHPDWCAGCEHCSNYRADLFDESEIGENAMCLDAACWEQRKVRLVEEQRAELQAKHKEVRTASDQDFRYGRIRDAKARKDKDHSVPVLIVDGDTAGKVFWAPSAKSANADSAGAGQTEPVPKQPTVEQKRMAWVIKKVDRMLNESMSAERRPCPFENFSGPHMAVRYAAQFGTQWNQRNADGSDWEELDVGSDDDALFALWTKVKPVLAMRIMFQAIIACEPAYDEAVLIAERLFNVSQADLDAEAAEAIKDKKGGK